MNKYENTNIPKNQVLIEVPSLTLAAIYISNAQSVSNKKFTIAEQVKACKDFIERRGWAFSGDLFVKKNGTDYIDALVRARAWFHFDYVIGYISSSGPEMGLIACFDAKQYALSKKPLLMNER